MEISPATTSPSPSATRTASEQDRAAAAITSDFDTFLKLLTAQISNQDPLNPINSEQFAVQLATFSGVEQQVRTNQLLEDMIGGQGQGGFGQMAAWVGMQARAPMPTWYQGQALSVSPPAPVAGDRHELVAMDAAGDEIWRGRYFPGTGNVTWDGVRADGTHVPFGTYGFQMESFEDERLVATVTAQTYGEVQEVRMDREGTVVVFAGGVERFANDVSALRRGGA